MVFFYSCGYSATCDLSVYCSANAKEFGVCSWVFNNFQVFKGFVSGLEGFGWTRDFKQF